MGKKEIVMQTFASRGSHKWGYYFSDRYKDKLAGNTHPNATGMAKMIKSGKRGL